MLRQDIDVFERVFDRNKYKLQTRDEEVLSAPNEALTEIEPMKKPGSSRKRRGSQLKQIPPPKTAKRNPILRRSHRIANMEAEKNKNKIKANKALIKTTKQNAARRIQNQKKKSANISQPATRRQIQKQPIGKRVARGGTKSKLTKKKRA